MTYSLRIAPGALDDLMAGYEWHEERALGLGDEFLQTFDSETEAVALSPLSYPKTPGPFRRRTMRRFPYTIYFELAGSEIRVAGVFHGARDPETIQAVLRDRRALEDL